MVQAVEGGEHGQELTVQGDIPGVLREERHVWRVSPRNLNHPLGPIHARGGESLIGKHSGKLSGTAAKIENGAARREMPQDQMVENRVYFLCKITPMPVVDAGKGVVCVETFHAGFSSRRRGILIGICIQESNLAPFMQELKCSNNPGLCPS